MNELDKYFEKARNVEPEYDEDDTRKFLAGKLSDGGIATNLYNKIKVYPMLTALITSVATIATIALLSISSPEIKTKKTSLPKHTTASVENLNSNEEEPKKSQKLLIVEDDILEAKVNEKEKLATRSLNWTDDSSIDVKAVNSLKLTKDELAKLGIEIDKKSFKVNAFDKYKYIIFKNNDKQRDYYIKDEDQGALPTPAMVTTASGFKTLTLFKKGNVEATVDRKRSVSEDGKSDEQRTISVSKYETDELFKDSPQFDFSEQSFADYQKSLFGNKDSAIIIKRMENFVELGININGKSTSFNIQNFLKAANNKDKELMKDLLQRVSDDVNVIMLNTDKKLIEGEVIDLTSERNVNVYSTDLERKDIDKIIQATLDSLPNKNSVLIEVDATEESSSNDPNNKTIYMPMESLGEGKKIKIINGEPSELEEKVYTETKSRLLIQDGESDLEFKLKPGQSIWVDEKQDGTNKAFSSNMSLDFMDYNINELIPIEISFDGVNTDFIVWYEAKEDFLKKLPINLLEKINPELAAISNQAQHCDNAPIKKDDAVMDVWSGCSGAIKEMKVFPNPANSNSKVEFSLEDNRQVSIAIYDLSGKLIKRVKNGMSLNKGQVTESLNLNGVNPGMYYVVVKSDIGEQALQRIIIE